MPKFRTNDTNEKSNDNTENNNDLIVEEKYQTAEMTPTSGEKETNKNKKLILAGIGLAVLIIIVIVIAVACSGKKNKPRDEPFIEPNKEITIEISHKLNEILKYHEDTNQTTSVNFNGDNNSKLRNLAERKQLNIIKGDYLLIIYGVNNTVSPKLYYAYAILNNLSKQKDGSKEINYLGGVEDITLLNEVSNNLPLLRFNFDENGKI